VFSSKARETWKMLKWNFQRNRTLVPEGFSKAISLVATVATKDDVLKISSFPLVPTRIIKDPGKPRSEG